MRVKKKVKKSFQQIIRNISEENKIRFYNLKLLFTIETDVLDYTIETILLQEGKLIIFMSKIMNQTEQNYEIFKKKILVII